MTSKWWELFQPAKSDGMDRRNVTVPLLQLFTESDIDPLTGTLKWDRFRSILEASALGTSGAVLIIDLTDQCRQAVEVDEAVADELLPLLAQALQQAIRSDDLIAHSGGFRFAVLLRGASTEVSRAVCERILASVEDTIVFSASGLLQVSVAVGGSRYENISDDAWRTAHERLEAVAGCAKSMINI